MYLESYVWRKSDVKLQCSFAATQQRLGEASQSEGAGIVHRQGVAVSQMPQMLERFVEALRQNEDGEMAVQSPNTPH